MEKFSFNRKEIDMIRTFHTLLKLDEKDTFTSDDFRMYGLDRYMKNPSKEIGMLFAKLKHNGYGETVGRTRSTKPSNNFREIKQWQFSGNMADFHFNKHRVKGVQ